MQVSEQAEFKNSVKLWLKSHGLDYRWIAEQCGVSEITVRNWMSQKNIPPLKQQLLERVMVQLPAVAAASSGEMAPGVKVSASLSLTIQLSPELYQKLGERALASGMSIEEFVSESIIRLAEGSTIALRGCKVVLPQD